MKQEIIQIENLKCGGCANSIISKISNMKGVEKVKVDHDNNSVHIDYDSDLERNDFEATLRKMGYPKTGESTLGLKAKSYVSCAIGRLSEAKDS